VPDVCGRRRPNRTAVISPQRKCYPLKLRAQVGETAFTVPYRSGRPGRSRLCNLLNVNQALCLLSYRSIWWTVTDSNRYFRRAIAASSHWTNSPLVDLAGVAPASSALPARRSPNRELKAQNHLRHFPETTVIVRGRRTIRLGDGLAAAGFAPVGHWSRVMLDERACVRPGCQGTSSPMEPPIGFAPIPAGYRPATLLLRQSGKWRCRRELPPLRGLDRAECSCYTTTPYGDLGRNPTCDLRLRRAALFVLSYKAKMATVPGVAPGSAASDTAALSG
jgi:hypothetical protein